jgi:hypothetical protein
MSTFAYAYVRMCTQVLHVCAPRVNIYTCGIQCNADVCMCVCVHKCIHTCRKVLLTWEEEPQHAQPPLMLVEED